MRRVVRDAITRSSKHARQHSVISGLVGAEDHEIQAQRPHSILVDGKHVLTCHDKLAGARRGRIGLAAHTGGEGVCSVFYANVVMTPLTDKY